MFLVGGEKDSKMFDTLVQFLTGGLRSVKQVDANKHANHRIHHTASIIEGLSGKDPKVIVFGGLINAKEPSNDVSTYNTGKHSISNI